MQPSMFVVTLKMRVSNSAGKYELDNKAVMAAMAWALHGLPAPTRGMWSASMFDPGLVTEVSQVEYGHCARKRTWLYTVGVGPVELRWDERPGTAVVGAGVNSGQAAGRGRVSSEEAIHTPIEFLELLIDMAKGVNTNDVYR